MKNGINRRLAFAAVFLLLPMVFAGCGGQADGKEQSFSHAAEDAAEGANTDNTENADNTESTADGPAAGYLWNIPAK